MQTLKIVLVSLGLSLSAAASGKCDGLKETDCKSTANKSNCEWTQNTCKDVTTKSKEAQSAKEASKTPSATPTKPTPMPDDLGGDEEDEGDF